MPTKAEVIHSPELFAKHFLWILDKEKTRRRLVWNAAQAHFMTNRTGRDIVLKARQLGFSTAIQGELFRRLVTSTRAVITLAHNDETTQKFRRMQSFFWENCKFGSVQPVRDLSNATVTTYPEFHSESITLTAGSGDAGRGGTYTDFHGSEVAFWNDPERIISGAMQAGNPDVILESTPNGAQGWYYDRCVEAMRGGGVWKLHFYPWWWDANYRITTDVISQDEYTNEELYLAEKYKLSHEQIAWRRQKHKELGRLFDQEYPEDVIKCFLSSGASYFGDIQGVFIPSFAKTADSRFVAGLDFGQEDDYTSLTILDKTTRQQADLLHIRRMEWGSIRARIIETCKRWKVRLVVAEKNSMGGTNIELLEGNGFIVYPFTTDNKSKSDIMENLYEGLHTGGLKVLDIPTQRQELTSFVSKQTSTGAWRLAASGDGHDDTVISLALAWRAATLPERLIDFM